MPSTNFNNPIFPGAKLIEAQLTITNVSGSYTNTVTDNRIAASMKPYALEVEHPEVFRDKITVIANGGSYTVSCPDVEGTSDLKISFLKIADDPTAMSSTEFDILSNRIGEVPEGETVEGQISALNNNISNIVYRASVAAGDSITINNVKNAAIISVSMSSSNYFIGFKWNASTIREVLRGGTAITVTASDGNVTINNGGSSTTAYVSIVGGCEPSE